MIAIVWEFIVREESIPEFRRAYGPGGEWAALFQRYPGFEGTTLLQDRATRGRFLTIDRWSSIERFDHMRRESRHEYTRLDTAFGALTVSERELGVFHLA
jgi:heme-degrading monooxygenase HmoA